MEPVQKRLPQVFDGMRRDINKLNDSIKKDPSNALLFDSVVASQLQDKSLSPEQRQEIMEAIESQHQKKGTIQAIGAGVSVGLWASSFIPQLAGISIGLRSEAVLKVL
jgi:predicted alpha/beta hydrolase family esterase